MFGKKKTIFNEVFGEIEYWDGWATTAKLEITLWDKTYDIRILAIADSTKDDINEEQEKTYKMFKEIIVERRSEIEEMIENHFGTRDKQAVSSRFIPTRLLFSRIGECALYAEDDEEEYDVSDDYDEGFVLGIIPELKIYSKELYSGYIFGGGML